MHFIATITLTKNKNIVIADSIAAPPSPNKLSLLS